MCGPSLLGTVDPPGLRRGGDGEGGHLHAVAPDRLPVTGAAQLAAKEESFGRVRTRDPELEGEPPGDPDREEMGLPRPDRLRDPVSPVEGHLIPAPARHDDGEADVGPIEEPREQTEGEPEDRARELRQVGERRRDDRDGVPSEIPDREEESRPTLPAYLAGIGRVALRPSDPECLGPGT